MAVRRLTPLECERLQGFPDEWTIPHDRYVVPARGIDNERYRTVGNAVCVPVVEWMAGRVSALLNCNTDRWPKRCNLADRMDAVSEDFTQAVGEVHPLNQIPERKKWKAGGCAFQGSVVDIPASTSPVSPIPSRFVDIVEKRRVDARYYLTPNAARGIIRRVDKMGRKLFAPLDASLRRLASSDEGMDSTHNGRSDIHKGKAR
jgi:DNA (cytosine-5)-methyltransferase 1